MPILQITDLVLAFLSLGLVGVLVVTAQYMWSRRWIRGEYSRKFVHMLTALFVATWRLYLPVWLVVAMAIVLGVGVLVTRHLQLFRSIYTVNRVTHGEASYAVAIGLTALFFQEPAVYALAIINLGFADGLAAIVGTKFGRRKYRIVGSTKTFAGVYACFVFAVFSGSVFWLAVGGQVQSAIITPHIHIVIGAIGVAILELIGQKGLDNLMIPIFTGIIFTGVV